MKNKIVALVVGIFLVCTGLLVPTPAQATGQAPCVPTAAWTETIEHPAVTHVVHHPAVTHVVHHEATPNVWYNWSPNHNQGPFNGPPAFPTDPRGTWHEHANNGGPRQGTFGTFQTGQPGHGDWFHRERGQAAYDETVVDVAAYDETIVDHEAYTETINHPAVTCEPPVTIPEPKHTIVKEKVIDNCSCYRDNAFVWGRHVTVHKSHPTRLKFVFHVTADEGYVIPSRIGGHTGWAQTQTYVIKTTNKVCPCKKRGDCHIKYPNFVPPTPACRGKCS